jgi:putative hemolysin
MESADLLMNRRISESVNLCISEGIGHVQRHATNNENEVAQAGSLRYTLFSEELFMSPMRRPETMKMEFAHG